MPRKKPGKRADSWEIKTRPDLLTPILEAKHDEMAKDIRQAYYSIDKVYERVAEILDRYGVHTQTRLLYRSYAERLWQIVSKFGGNTAKNLANAMATLFNLYGADEQILKEIALLFNLKVEVVVGVTKLSQLIIDIDKDWGGHVIKNLGTPTDPYDSARKTEVDAVQTNLDSHAAATGGVHGVPSGEYILPSGEKGVANGIAPLDANAQVPLANLPDIPNTKILTATGYASVAVAVGSYGYITMNDFTFFPSTYNNLSTGFYLISERYDTGEPIARLGFYNQLTINRFAFARWRYITSSENIVIIQVCDEDGRECGIWVSEPVRRDGEIIKPIDIYDSKMKEIKTVAKVFDSGIHSHQAIARKIRPDDILEDFRKRAERKYRLIMEI